MCQPVSEFYSPSEKNNENKLNLLKYCDPAPLAGKHL